MELNDKDLELIAKIDEMLTKLKSFGKSLWELREHASLVLQDVKPDNEQQAPVEGTNIQYRTRQWSYVFKCWCWLLC